MRSKFCIAALLMIATGSSVVGQVNCTLVNSKKRGVDDTNIGAAKEALKDAWGSNMQLPYTAEDGNVGSACNRDFGGQAVSYWLYGSYDFIWDRALYSQKSEVTKAAKPRDPSYLDSIKRYQCTDSGNLNRGVIGYFSYGKTPNKGKPGAVVDLGFLCVNSNYRGQSYGFQMLNEAATLAGVGPNTPMSILALKSATAFYNTIQLDCQEEAIEGTNAKQITYSTRQQPVPRRARYYCEDGNNAKCENVTYGCISAVDYNDCIDQSRRVETTMGHGFHLFTNQVTGQASGEIEFENACEHMRSEYADYVH